MHNVSPNTIIQINPVYEKLLRENLNIFPTIATYFKMVTYFNELPRISGDHLSIHTNNPLLILEILNFFN